MVVFIIGTVVLIALFFLFKSNNKQASNDKELRSLIRQVDKENDRYEKLYLVNKYGSEYEDKGEIQKAIKTYEVGLEMNTDTPATYFRLAILYRKRGDQQNEIRVIKKGLNNLTKKRAKQRLKERLEKVTNM